jgi:hypothetical protein
MEALASVVANGDSMIVWTAGEMLSGWNVEIAMKNLGAKEIPTHQELGELRTMKKILNIATTRENEVRAELNKLMRGLSASIKVLEGRSKQAIRSDFCQTPLPGRNLVGNSQVSVPACDRYCGATGGASNYCFACVERNKVQSS